MRTTLVSVLAVLAQWGILANAQPQAGALPAWPAATNGYLAHPPTKRLFFFMSDPKNIGRPAVFGRPLDRKNIVRPAQVARLPIAVWKPRNLKLAAFRRDTKFTCTGCRLTNN